MNNHVEMKAVKEVIERYISASYTADVDALKSVFHEKAVMNGYLGPDCVLADPSAYVADIAGAPSMESAGDSYDAQIESIYVEGNVASVVVSETGFRGEGVLVDVFQLIKVEDEWKVISKLFTTL